MRTEPLTGWRLWHVECRRGQAQLLSWSRAGVWPARTRMEARCSCRFGLARHASPETGSRCGIYAVRERALLDRLLDALPGTGGRPLAIGRVSLWGRVVENVDGWRAEFAYPYDLVLRRGDEATAAALRRAYLVDVALD